MERHPRRWQAVFAAVALGTALLLAGGPSSAGPGSSPSAQRLKVLRAMAGLRPNGEGGGENQTLMDQAAQYESARLAPGADVSSNAVAAARAQASHLPVAGGSWSQITTQPYQNDDPNFADPVISNSGAGWGLVSGRMTALAHDGSTVYAGAADGGVWKSTDGGTTWKETTDSALPNLSVGSLAVNPDDHSVWVGLGEANTNSDSYFGAGVYRSPDGGNTWARVGGSELDKRLIYRLRLDGQGLIYAATSRGLYRHSTTTLSSPWTLVLRPDPNPSHSPYRTSHITDVLVLAGTGGQDVFAVLGWRGGTRPEDVSYNGFYLSTSGGGPGTFQRIQPFGNINAADIGRTSLAQASDGRIYAVIESPSRLAAPDPNFGFSALLGVFVTKASDPAGPWKLIANAKELANSGSAFALLGDYPGVQSWYDMWIDVDPSDPNHVYLGLEEIFETKDGGGTWKTIGPYWNFLTSCFPNCPMTTHPDQHGEVIVGNTLYVGNDGGVYSRPLDGDSWTNLNRNLHTLQYYYAGVGKVKGGDAYWGGLQDNGESLLLPSKHHMVSPFGGDGGDTLVDSNNGNRAVNEYVLLDMWRTENGGRSDGSTSAFTEISPSCYAFTYTPNPCDPSPRFIAPFRADVHNLNHWIAGGEYVWETTLGWDTTCSASACDWQIIHDTGAGHSITAIAVNGSTMYAGWCGNCNIKATTPFLSHIDTNYGGTWHTLTPPNLPNRFIASLTVDPSDPAHVYATYNGFSRRWVPGAGVGHVFESVDGGGLWTDITGNLPDAPGDDLIIINGSLVLATDIGVFIADAGDPTHWSVFGTGLPAASTNDLTVSPDGSYIVAATHGRGLWKLASP